MTHVEFEKSAPVLGCVLPRPGLIGEMRALASELRLLRSRVDGAVMMLDRSIERRRMLGDSLQHISLNRLRREAQVEYGRRLARIQHFPIAVTGDQAWDLLLVLYARARGEPMEIQQLQMLGCGSPASIDRSIRLLASRGLVEHVAGAGPEARLVRLTDDAQQRMTDCMIDAVRLGMSRRAAQLSN